MKSKLQRRIKRHKKIKKSILGVRSVLRLAVFRSNKYIYAQIINDNNKGEIITAVSEKEVSGSGTKSERAFLVGKLIAEKAVKKKVKTVVFDRGGYKYHGRVESLGRGAREGGLAF